MCVWKNMLDLLNRWQFSIMSWVKTQWRFYSQPQLKGRPTETSSAGQKPDSQFPSPHSLSPPSLPLSPQERVSELLPAERRTLSLFLDWIGVSIFLVVRLPLRKAGRGWTSHYRMAANEMAASANKNAKEPIIKQEASWWVKISVTIAFVFTGMRRLINRWLSNCLLSRELTYANI